MINISFLHKKEVVSQLWMSLSEVFHTYIIFSNSGVTWKTNEI